jgi:hypothetical protein
VDEVDNQIPHLPPKDCILRIYRDVRQFPVGTFLANSYNRRQCSLQVRFSNDKTPYKTNFAASFSRGGRKGIFAHCEFRGFPPVYAAAYMMSGIRLHVRILSCLLHVLDLTV